MISPITISATPRVLLNRALYTGIPRRFAAVSAPSKAPGLARAMREIELTLLAAPYEPASCTRTFPLAVADLGQVIWSPQLAIAMRREMPLAHLRVVGIDALVSLGDLGSSEIDLHLGVPARGRELRAEPLLKGGSCSSRGAIHPVFDRRLTRPALGELRHVSVEMVPGKNFRDPLAATYVRAGVPREIVVTVPSFTAAAEIVATSDLVTMLPTSFLRARARARSARVAAPLPAHTIQIAMCWHDRTHADPAARAFRVLVRGVVTERQRPWPRRRDGPSSAASNQADRRLR